METAGSGARGTQRFVVTEPERQVADLLPIEVDPVLARATVQAVPFWFHTFALNRPEGIFTPGFARGQRYRVAMLPVDFAGMRVLDVGRFRWLLRVPRRASRGRAGAGGRQRAVPAMGRFPLGNQAGGRGGISREPSPCWARRSGIGGWTRSRSTVSTSVSLRHSSSGGERAGAVACAAWTDGSAAGRC